MVETEISFFMEDQKIYRVCLSVKLLSEPPGGAAGLGAAAEKSEVLLMLSVLWALTLFCLLSC